jgi:hypothetical protein
MAWSIQAAEVGEASCSVGTGSEEVSGINSFQVDPPCPLREQGTELG